MTSMTRPTARRTANALGWLSIGLGVAELAGAGRMLGMMGGRRTGMTRFYGLREVATGIGLLAAAVFAHLATHFAHASGAEAGRFGEGAG